MSEAQTPKDIWESKLEEKLLFLKNCQQEKSLQSCFKCEKILDCQVRKDYVKAVYESMNKGQTGDFEF
ncbi:hypothetical protein BKH41_02000 [Helicobacter sp. 12S02232-10]|uniref:hypothetical protein n=1 Tax=Helicobacter sp. 12S02232-10 TaxID=1476197 RepID=UPI000BA5DECE|nr:hypothetical protein [Helicobacter sp. 12S02232-10]PAF49459.1 hypothetical protein BKH41_02000 [Helicobacter sp. 12S02232-10]